LNLDDNALKPLYDDALKIADGTWESYHQKHDALFEEAVKALVEMGNCSYQRHLNQEQANAIEAFLAFEDGDRTQLCSDIWDKASPKINYYWRDGTFDALEELRTKELYNRSYSNGRSI
jgi:L-rhamnose mutarotase